jgi:hypothetical protein
VDLPAEEGGGRPKDQSQGGYFLPKMHSITM